MNRQYVTQFNAVDRYLTALIDLIGNCYAVVIAKKLNRYQYRFVSGLNCNVWSLEPLKRIIWTPVL